ncbi:MAG: hypothetical protein VKN72_28725 [Nostocales cyanobacterium 94392]|nr:hypothetical protein [Nostocales cyanobacterium 94392]
MRQLKLSILVGVSMLLLMPNVASAQNNSVGESINSQSSSIGLQCDSLLGVICW